MKASCIQHPANEPLVVVRAWQMDFCQGNGCAATLLSYYEYWHNIKIAMVERHKKANDIAEMHGDKRRFDESLLQFHTYEEIGEGIAHLFGRSSLVKANKALEALGVISVYKNPNPKYQFDKTRYTLFHPEVCQRWLDARANATPSVSTPASSAPVPTSNATAADTPTSVSSSTSTLAPAEARLEGEKDAEPAGAQHCDLDTTQSTALVSSTASATTIEPQRSTSASEGSTFDCKRQTIACKSPITETTTETTQEIIKKTTTQQQQGNITTYTSASVAEMPTLTQADHHLGATLTSRQQQCVEVVAQRLKPYVPSMTVPTLVQQVTATLVDKQRLSNAGTDFRKKLNTLAKLIRQQQWRFTSSTHALPTPATSPPPPPSSEATVTRDTLLEEMRLLESEQRHWQSLIDCSDKPEHEKRRRQFHVFLTQTEQKLAHIRQALQQPTTCETRTTSS